MSVVLDFTQPREDAEDQEHIVLNSGREAVLVSQDDVDIQASVKNAKVIRRIRQMRESDDEALDDMQLYRDLLHIFIPDITEEEVATMKNWQLRKLFDFFGEKYQVSGSIGPA